MKQLSKRAQKEIIEQIIIADLNGSKQIVFSPAFDVYSLKETYAELICEAFGADVNDSDELDEAFNELFDDYKHDIIEAVRIHERIERVKSLIRKSKEPEASELAQEYSELARRYLTVIKPLEKLIKIRTQVIKELKK